MSPRDYHNAMVVLRALVNHHRTNSGSPASMYTVYKTARAAGVGWLRSWDIATSFAKGADRLVEVGLAIRVPNPASRDRLYSPSPVGLLVYHQHPSLFPQPEPAKPKPEISARGWRLTLSTVAVLAAIACILMRMVGAPWSAVQWPVGFAIGAALVVLLTPRRAFRLRR